MPRTNMPPSANPRLIALMGLLLFVSGCLGASPPQASLPDESGTPSMRALPAGSTAPYLVDAQAVYDDPAYARLQFLFESHPGFLALAPALDGTHRLFAVFEGIAAPDGWTLEVVEHAATRRLRERAEAVTNVAAPVPENAVGIGPGSPMLQTIPDEGTFILRRWATSHDATIIVSLIY